jgi:CPA1 family monovalent cation:H+ antiporter
MLALEVILIGLAVLAVLAIVAQYLDLPYPVLLVLGGIVLGFVPGVPALVFEPELVFLLFVPPLVMSAAWGASWQELRANQREIVGLSVGLVLMTMTVVAVVAYWLIPGMTWAVAFVLGAIVSDTDATAVTAIAERLRLPRQIVAILEGESLGNDATSLVSYRMAIAAVVTGTFSFRSAVIEFLFAAIVGVALGLLTAYLYVWIQRRLNNPSVEVVITLLLPFAAYLPADHLGASGVLAVVAAGLYAGQREAEIRSSVTRLQAAATWNTLVFVLNGLIFILLGLQLRTILDGVAGRPASLLARDAAIVIVTVVLARIVWMVGVTGLLSMLRRAARFPGEPLPWNSVPLVAWAGMRGASTMVIALAIPLTTNAGTAFPDRALVIFLTFCVVVVTLLVEGLSLPQLVQRTGLREDANDTEVARTRAAAHAAAVRRIDELAGGKTLSDHVARLRAYHELRAKQFAARSDGSIDQAAAQRAESVQQLRQDLLQVERREIIDLHARGDISDTSLRAVLYDLDLEEQQGE